MHVVMVYSRWDRLQSPMHLGALYAYYGPADALPCSIHDHVHDMGPVGIKMFNPPGIHASREGLVLLYLSDPE
jgi:hypothetical protein